MVESRRVTVREGVAYAVDPCALASSHPFVQQIDLIIPTAISASLLDNLMALKSHYFSRKATLLDFLESTKPFISPWQLESKIVAIGKPAYGSDDVWCLDPNGTLTIAVGKDTYERLGFVGQRPQWKPWKDLHFIQFSLPMEALKPEPWAGSDSVSEASKMDDDGSSQQSPEKGKSDTNSGNRKTDSGSTDATPQNMEIPSLKRRAIIEAWDSRRGPWDIVYVIRGDASSHTVDETIEKHDVVPSVCKMENVIVPSITLEPPPNKQSSGELEDWEEQTAALFEWVGMAGFGSDRLKSRDNVDPYIAVYDPPFEMREETVTRVRWNGLLSEDLMQRIMDVALSIYPLMAIVGHGVPIAPVGINTRNPWSPCRVPRAESEDSWSLIINRSGPNAVGRWLLCESLGQWDARN